MTLRTANQGRGWLLGTAVLILLLTTALYAPALNFGFWWDDPVWYSHMPGRAWWELLLPVPEFQYYRPGSMLYVSLFLRDDGTYAAPLLHWAQIGWHLLNGALLLAIARRLRLNRWAAGIALLLFLLHPFLYQAAAWAAPNQPMAGAFQNGAWLLFLVAQARRERRLYGLSLLLFFAALTLQESGAALAPAPLLLAWSQRMVADRDGWRLPALLRHGWRALWGWPLLYLLLGGLFTLVWALAPRKEGITGVALDGRTAVYLWQGWVYPLLGRLRGYDPEMAQPFVWVAALFLLVSAALLGWAARRGRGAVALAAWLWGLLAILPAVIGLRYSYVAVGPRLLYAAAPGIVLLWAAALGGAGRKTPLVGAALALLIAGQSGLLLRQFATMYAAGTAHLQQTVTVLSAPEGQSALFVNYPDRYAPRRAPYPLGYWGMTLAPVVVELGDFPPVLTGAAAQTTSRAAPWLDAAAREAAPWQVDMRGVIVTPDELLALAAGQDGVYVTEYGANGRFTLRFVGKLAAAADSGCALARFGDALCLQAVALTPTDAGLQLDLRWQALAPLPPALTVFVHLGAPGQPPLAQADGDGWGGLLPPALWPVDRLVVDRRVLAGETAVSTETAVPAGMSVRVGVYDRLTGERWSAVAVVDGAERPLPDGAWPVGE